MSAEAVGDRLSSTDLQLFSPCREYCKTKETVDNLNKEVGGIVCLSVARPQDLCISCLPPPPTSSKHVWRGRRKGSP